MSLKDILIHLDNQDTCKARIDAALALAQVHDAHLTGLYTIPEMVIPTYAEVHIPIEIMQEQEAEAQETAERVGMRFKDAVDKMGCAGQWHCVKGFADQHVDRFARYTDLVVIGQTQGAAPIAAYSDLPDQVVMGSARPVLLIPYIGTRKNALGKRIMVAWNSSREAVRAVNDALPLLQKADQVEVLAINPPAAEGDIPTADICLHLARHGVNAEASQTVAKGIDVGDVLLSRAADHDIDLIVMGAYGHNRLRESIFGGATRHLLDHMTVPVLMSH